MTGLKKIEEKKRKEKKSGQKISRIGNANFLTPQAKRRKKEAIKKKVLT